MLSKTLRLTTILAAGAVAWLLDAGTAQQAWAQRPAYVTSQYDLFYNYYVNGGAGQPAQLYVSPRPVPPFVGHTYTTYQPLLPQEFLYKHRRTYRRHISSAVPVNTTHVRWW
jgi:hypothetical protein